jgi:cbb3-type cytochrome oxidase subunit 3
MNLASLASGGVTVVKNRAFQWFLVVFAILLIAYLIYRQGQKSGGFQAAAKLPNNGSGIPQGWTPTKLVDELWDNLGTIFWSWTERNSKIETLLNLTPDQLAAVYNDYNYRYGKKDGNTSLTKKISKEVFLLRQSEILSKLRSYGLY